MRVRAVFSASSTRRATSSSSPASTSGTGSTGALRPMRHQRPSARVAWRWRALRARGSARRPAGCPATADCSGASARAGALSAAADCPRDVRAGAAVSRTPAPGCRLGATALPRFGSTRRAARTARRACASPADPRGASRSLRSSARSTHGSCNTPDASDASGATALWSGRGRSD